TELLDVLGHRQSRVLELTHAHVDVAQPLTTVPAVLATDDLRGVPRLVGTVHAQPQQAFVRLQAYVEAILRNRRGPERHPEVALDTPAQIHVERQRTVGYRHRAADLTGLGIPAVEPEYVELVLLRVL